MSGSTGSGLRSSLRRLFDHALELLQTRLELLGTELELEAQRIFDALLRGAAALLLLGFALLFTAAFVVALLWDHYRLPALAGVALCFAIAGVWLLRDARARLHQSGGSFAASVAELARDREQMPPRD
jgi:uncharacterized membrane protein YqjE